MSKNKIRIMTFLLLGTILLTGCQKGAKSNSESGVYAQYPSTETLSPVEPSITDETIEIMPPFGTDTIPDYVETFPNETEEETFIPETTEEEEEVTIPPVTTEKEEEVKPPVTTEEEIKPIEPVITDEVAIVTGKANLRTSNTTESLIITQLQLHDKVYKLMSCDEDWDLVRCNEYVGYIHKSNLEYIEEDYQEEYIHTVYNDIVLTTGKLNFRTLPSTEGEIHYTLTPNTELIVIAMVDNGWLLVKYNGIVGYVHGSYTQSMTERAKELYPELDIQGLKTQKVVRTTSNLNFRTGPSTEFDSLGLFEPYESLRVMGEYGDWYFVMTNDYNFGYIHKGYTLTLTDRNVIVDKSEQQLYLYEDNELLFTTPVTTGKDSTPSDTGHFRINYKTTNVTLTDNETYWSPVKYWMPYNGGEGLHDANWRSVFGEEDYHYSGSHGCINIPPDIADDIYNNVEQGTKVLVHK